MPKHDIGVVLDKSINVKLDSLPANLREAVKELTVLRVVMGLWREKTRLCAKQEWIISERWLKDAYNIVHRQNKSRILISIDRELSSVLDEIEANGQDTEKYEKKVEVLLDEVKRQIDNHHRN